MMSNTHTIRVLLLGEQNIGKTSLARTVTEGAFPSVDSLPAKSDGCIEYKSSKDTTIRAGDSSYVIHIFDPDNQDTIKELVSKTDLHYLCFDLSNPETLQAVRKKWYPYLKMATKIILVGLKSDLAYDKTTCRQLENQGLRPITQGDIGCLFNEIKACHYLEVSSLRYVGIEQLKDKTLFTYMEQDNPHKIKGTNRCVIT